MSEFKKRIVDPVTVPIVAAGFIFALVFSFSRILLAIPEKGSTTVALLIAAEILGVCAMLAAVTRLNASQRAVLVALALALVGGGAGAAEIGIRDIEKIGNEITVVAKGIKFTTTTLDLPADSDVTLKFVNDDSGIPHNVAITKDDAGTDKVFGGEIFPGVATRAYKVPPLKAGGYFFHCDVHPTLMKGEVVVGGVTSPAGGSAAAAPTPKDTGMVEAPAGGEAATEADVLAKGIAFDPVSLTMKASVKDMIHFQNDDSATPHNIVITTQDGGGTTVFDGEIITGPAHTEYSFTGPKPGMYFFHCEVHPPMKGQIEFA